MHSYQDYRGMQGIPDFVYVNNGVINKRVKNKNVQEAIKEGFDLGYDRNLDAIAIDDIPGILNPDLK